MNSLPLKQRRKGGREGGGWVTGAGRSQWASDGQPLAPWPPPALHSTTLLSPSLPTPSSWMVIYPFIHPSIHERLHPTPPSVQDWSPHMSFILEGSQISAVQLKGCFKSKTSIQEYRNANTKPILNLCMNHMGHASNTMGGINNQPSNSTSCSDNTLRSWLVLVAGGLYWELQVTSSFQNRPLS